MVLNSFRSTHLLPILTKLLKMRQEILPHPCRPRGLLDEWFSSLQPSVSYLQASVPALTQYQRIMDHFNYRNRILHCEEIPVAELAEKYGTPLFVYSQATLLHHLKQLQTAFAPAASADLLQHQDQRQYPHLPA